jgi:hypothetical protein
MTFLNPLFLFGLIAASIPILLHLLNLRKLKTVEFGTLRFLKRLQRRNIRRVKLKQWLLLALRTLIIALVALAFARPAADTTAFAAIGSETKRATVVVLDDSFSMEALEAEGSKFNRAKEAARVLVDRAREGDETAIVFVSRPETARLSTDRAALREAIEDAPLSFRSADLHAAVARAVALLAESNQYAKELFILSDFQASRLRESDVVSNFSDVLGERVEIALVDYRSNAFNLAVEEVATTTRLFKKGGRLGFEATIANHADRDVADAVVSLFVGGVRSAQASRAVPSGGRRAAELETTAKDAGFLDVFVEIEEDAVSADNRRYLAPEIPERTRVRIFSDSPHARFLDAALEASEATEAIVSPLSRADAVDPSEYDVAIVVGWKAGMRPTRMKTFVESGGGVLLAPAPESSLSELAAAAAFFGYQAPLAIVELPPEREGVRFSDVDFRHPIFAGMFADDETREIDSPTLRRLVRYGAGGQTVVATPVSPFLFERRLGEGTALILASTPTLASGDFPLKGVFAPLTFAATQYLANFDLNQTPPILVGEPIRLFVEARVSGRALVVRPDGAEEFAEIVTRGGGRYAIYEETDLPGVYRFRSGNRELGAAAANVDPRESDLTPATDEALATYFEELGAANAPRTLDPDDDLETATARGRASAELWKPLLIAALILALIETAVARVSKRDAYDEDATS